jgi:hypothetical protein
MPIVKLVYCVHRHPDLTAEQFADYWLNRHGPLVRGLFDEGRFPGMVRYVQSHAVDGDAGRAARGGMAAPYDGITEVWFDAELQGGDDAVRAASAEAGQRLLADESTFIDFGRSTAFMTVEHTIFEA